MEERFRAASDASAVDQSLPTRSCGREVVKIQGPLGHEREQRRAPFTGA